MWGGVLGIWLSITCLIRAIEPGYIGVGDVGWPQLDWVISDDNPRGLLGPVPLGFRKAVVLNPHPIIEFGVSEPRRPNLRDIKIMPCNGYSARRHVVTIMACLGTIREIEIIRQFSVKVFVIDTYPDPLRGYLTEILQGYCHTYFSYNIRVIRESHRTPVYTSNKYVRPKFCFPGLSIVPKSISDSVVLISTNEKESKGEGGEDNSKEGNGVRDNFSRDHPAYGANAIVYWLATLPGALSAACGYSLLTVKRGSNWCTFLGMTMSILGIGAMYFGYLALGA
jgi:hypothetical protein